MTAVLTAPFIPISKNLSSHRAAQGVIYGDQLREAGIDLYINMSLDRYVEDHNTFDAMYVYHGNDWSGHLNLFGGLKEFPHVDNFLNFSKFKGKIYSLVIDFPDYYDQLKHKVDLAVSKNKEIDPRWLQVDWENIKRMEKEAVTVIPNDMVQYPNVSVGDSHAICMYRPGWNNLSIPFKTLHGALKMGLKSFLPERPLEKAEFYFGNIDVRHHLLRQENPEQATRSLVQEYFDQAKSLNLDVMLYELLPPENEKRSIPKTGWYNGTPFYGSRKDRNEIRLIFKDEALKQQNDRVRLYQWVSGLTNELGELDFKYMERPKSVHLSREAYPHWQGLDWNGLTENLNRPVYHSTLEAFL